jgi:hypothetical protein
MEAPDGSAGGTLEEGLVSNPPLLLNQSEVALGGSSCFATLNRTGPVHIVGREKVGQTGGRTQDPLNLVRVRCHYDTQPDVRIHMLLTSTAYVMVLVTI